MSEHSRTSSCEKLLTFCGTFEFCYLELCLVTDPAIELLPYRLGPEFYWRVPDDEAFRGPLFLALACRALWDAEFNPDGYSMMKRNNYKITIIQRLKIQNQNLQLTKSPLS